MTTSTTETLTIVTTPAVKSLIEELVASGTYASESDVLEEGLRMLREKREREETIRAVKEGVADAEAGRFSTVEEVFEQIYQKHPELRSD